VLRGPMSRSRTNHFQVGKLKPHSYVPFSGSVAVIFEFVWLECCHADLGCVYLSYEHIVELVRGIVAGKQWRDLLISPRRASLA